MPNEASITAIATAHLIQSVDSARKNTDHFKLPAFLRTELDEKLAVLETADNATAVTESERAGGSKERRAAVDRLEALVRDGFNGIKAIKSFKISDADRLRVFTAYGWAGGKLGELTDGRVIGLARLARQPKPTDFEQSWLYEAELLAKIGEELAIIGTVEEDATGSDRVEATRRRNEALDVVESLLTRVRFYYCCASPDTDQTAELLKIGLSPRSPARAAAATAPRKGSAPAGKPATATTTA